MAKPQPNASIDKQVLIASKSVGILNAKSSNMTSGSVAAAAIGNRHLVMPHFERAFHPRTQPIIMASTLTVP